eukprot:CAMPEP_0175083620 /NCGR_PEP_ID=MMETSP0052_2-20121109/27508_1 /TAXON_ID=51329 ORGANISM="Polytomella parva, Strain SAG 63-3" /NCGR_SAMPLE_ID=MMETSP0052_2 /ASSEMBLY_ACC=CAM_ASM_000194 /LENGTH=874 /DNA_ID=CAMNT_0016355139 /DNA_START=72 /DNA_END=2693 /DNA_ORIENTATION=-
MEGNSLNIPRDESLEQQATEFKTRLYDEFERDRGCSFLCKSGRNPFFKLVYDGCVNEAERMLETQPDLALRFMYSGNARFNACHIAAEKGNIEMIKLIIRYAELYEKTYLIFDVGTSTPDASNRGISENVLLLPDLHASGVSPPLPPVPPSSSSVSNLSTAAAAAGSSPAQPTAAKDDRRERFKRRVQGIMFKLSTLVSYTEVVSGESLVVRLLHCRTSNGVAALGLAAQNDHPKVVELLLSLGADPWQSDLLGRCAVHLAAATGAVEALRVLLAAGINESSAAAGGGAGRPPSLRAFPTNGSSVSLVDATDAFGFTPLHYATWGSRLECMSMLIASGANLIARSRRQHIFWPSMPLGSSPLHVACRNACLPSIKMILRAYYETSADLMPQQTARLDPEERRRRARHHPDPRLVLTRCQRLPFHLALLRTQSHSILEWLDPSVPLMFLFGGDEEIGAENGSLVVVSRLSVIAARTLHALLISQIDAVEAERNRRKQAAAGDKGLREKERVVEGKKEQAEKRKEEEEGGDGKGGERSKSEIEKQESRGKTVSEEEESKNNNSDDNNKNDDSNNDNSSKSPLNGSQKTPSRSIVDAKAIGVKQSVNVSIYGEKSGDHLSPSSSAAHLVGEEEKRGDDQDRFEGQREGHLDLSAALLSSRSLAPLQDRESTVQKRNDGDMWRNDAPETEIESAVDERDASASTAFSKKEQGRKEKSEEVEKEEEKNERDKEQRRQQWQPKATDKKAVKKAVEVDSNLATNDIFDNCNISKANDNSTELLPPTSEPSSSSPSKQSNASHKIKIETNEKVEQKSLPPPFDCKGVGKEISSGAEEFLKLPSSPSSPHVNVSSTSLSLPKTVTAASDMFFLPTSSAAAAAA